MVSIIFLIILTNFLKVNAILVQNKKPTLFESKYTINLTENGPSNLEKEIPPLIYEYSLRQKPKYHLKFINISLKNDAYAGSDFEIEQIGKINSRVTLKTFPNKLVLVFVAPFDAEIIKSFIFNIIAVDNKNRSTNSCQVIVNILNVNDNCPWFDRVVYESKFNVKQVLPFTPLIQIHAYDDDGDSIKYSLLDQPLALTVSKKLSFNFDKLRVNELFFINEKTGVIYVGPNFSLSSKLSPTYSLTVQATDSNLVTSVNVNIFLNDDKPLIKFNFSNLVTETKLENEVKQIFISELLLPKSNLGKISFYNEYPGDNGTFLVEIKQFKERTTNQSNDSITRIHEESSDFQITLTKSVNYFSFSIFTNNCLNRENFYKYIIFINSSYNSQPPIESNMILEIYLNDENDNSPLFLKDQYEFDLSRIQTVDLNGWILTGRVEAIDSDLGENANINYKIEMTNIDKCKFFKLFLQEYFIPHIAVKALHMMG